MGRASMSFSDKSTESHENIVGLTKEWQNTDYYEVGHEWVYKGLSREIIAEKLITNKNDQIPKDWKFFCFHGDVTRVIVRRNIGRQMDEPRAAETYTTVTLIELKLKLLYPSYSGGRTARLLGVVRRSYSYFRIIIK
ncbi:MAG: ATP-grasp fold amidoligase family protein [Gracilimonas sp.]|nr:ATP-grasp fold amidoligase family protein [Gracilimonas sp.]